MAKDTGDKPEKSVRKKADKTEPKSQAKPEPIKVSSVPADEGLESGDRALSNERKTGRRGGGMPSRKTIIVVLGSVLVGLLVFLGVFGVLIYKYKSDSDLVFSVAKVVPYPAERVNGRFVTYGQYLFEFRSVKHFYGKRVGAEGKPMIDFSTPEGQARLGELRKQILEQLKTDTVARQLIAEHKIEVTEKEVDDQIDQLAKQAGAEEKPGADKFDGIKKVLAEYYGWTLDDLRPKVKFQLGKQKLQEKLANDESVQAQAKTKTEEILNKVKAGGDFAELAKEHSQDSSAANGGDLGFFDKGKMVSEFEAAAFALQPGQVSDIVKTKYGYHIIKVLEKKDDQVHAAHILIKSVDFDQYLRDRVTSAKVATYIKV